MIHPGTWRCPVSQQAKVTFSSTLLIQWMRFLPHKTFPKPIYLIFEMIFLTCFISLRVTATNCLYASTDPQGSQTHSPRCSCCWAGRDTPSISLISSSLTCTAVAMVILTCQLRQHWWSDCLTASWQVRMSCERALKCSAGSSAWLTNSWFRNSCGCSSAAVNWWASFRFWLTGLIMDFAKMADTLVVTLNLK